MLQTVEFDRLETGFGSASAWDTGTDYEKAQGHKREAAVAPPDALPARKFDKCPHHADHDEHNTKSEPNTTHAYLSAGSGARLTDSCARPATVLSVQRSGKRLAILAPVDDAPSQRERAWFDVF
jgi:hypothetical protein